MRRHIEITGASLEHGKQETNLFIYLFVPFFFVCLGVFVCLSSFFLQYLFMYYVFI